VGSGKKSNGSKPGNHDSIAPEGRKQSGLAAGTNGSYAELTASAPRAICQQCREMLKSTILASEPLTPDQAPRGPYQSDGSHIYKPTRNSTTTYVIGLKEIADRKPLCSFCHLLNRLVRQIILDVFDYEARNSLDSFQWAGRKLVLTGDQGLSIANQSPSLAGRVLRADVPAVTQGRTENTIIAISPNAAQGVVPNRAVDPGLVDFNAVRSWLQLCL
jgi:hypothetical protein